MTINLANLRAPTITFNQEAVIYTYYSTGLSGNSVITTGIARAANDSLVRETCPNHFISVTLSSGPLSGTNLLFGNLCASVVLHAQPAPYFPSGILPNGLPRRLPPRSAWKAANMALLGYSGDLDTVESCSDPPDSAPPVGPCPTGSPTSPPAPPAEAPEHSCTLQLHNKAGETVRVTAEVDASARAATGHATTPFAYRFTSSGGELLGLLASGPLPCCDSYGVPKPLPAFIATEADEVISGAPTAANAAKARCRISLTSSPRAPVLLTAAEMETVPPPLPADRSEVPTASPLGQTPFHFPDVLLLEERIGEMNDQNRQDFEPTLVQDEMLHHYTRSPDTSYPLEPLEPAYFQDAGWVGLMFEADRDKNHGGFEKAEKRLRFVLAMLRRIQGPETDAVATVLDHLGEFYLEKRDIEGAYRIFSEALRVRRQTLAALPNAQAGTGLAADNEPRAVYRLHLAELLTRLGQLDLARARWDLAAKELGEAVAITNESANLEYLNGMYALYFESILLEASGQWRQAEVLWQDAAARRASLVKSEAYWNVLIEMSAFYARRGDFHTAAAVVRRVDTGIDDIHSLTPALPIPYLSNRPRTPPFLYDSDGRLAMKDILALDTWQSDGPEAAAQLVEDLLQGEGSTSYIFGTGSELARLVAWIERRTFLRLSVLLDGTPSQERINTAYDHLRKFKDRYLVDEIDMHRRFERERDQSRPTHPQHLAELDVLAEIRRRLARLFIASAIDGEPVNTSEFSRLEMLEQRVSRVLISANGEAPEEYFQTLQGKDLGADSVLIDFFKWRRTDRQTMRLLPEEYGAFVTLQKEPVHYIPLGLAAPIDRDIQSLMQPGQSPEVFREALHRLYRCLITPIENRLGAPASTSGGMRKLFIAPDGMLALAPFAGFIDDTGRYLLERATVSYLNTTLDLRHTDTPREPSNEAVIVANPDFDLPLAAVGTAPSRRPGQPFTPRRNFEIEAREVAKRLGVGPDQIVAGEKARADQLRGLNGPEVLHFATHTVPNIGWEPPLPGWDVFEFPQFITARHPTLRSFIALAGANRKQLGDENGLLTGLEIEGLHLVGTKLVVLSTCEAGQVQPVDGEGLVGLRTAFAIAGAEGVLTNLWKVNDEASLLFMKFFYSHFADNVDPAEMLRMAQQQMIRETPYTDPYYWAGYQYAGTSAPPRLPSPDSARPAAEPSSNPK